MSGRTLATLEPDGKIELLPEEITTREAAELLHCSVRHVQQLCDEGHFEEGRDWRKMFPQGARGTYRISREAVLRLRAGKESCSLKTETN